MKITTKTVLSTQEKKAHFDRMTAGKGETFKTRYSALHNDVRSWALEYEGTVIPASLDMLNAVTGHSAYGFTEAVNKQIDAMGLDVSRMYRTDSNGEGCNMKAIKRFHQMLNSMSNAAAPHKGIDTVSIIILLSLEAAGDYALAHDALFYMGVGNVRREGLSPELRGVSRSEVLRIIWDNFANRDKKIHPATMLTKISRSIGQDGFMTNAGMVERIKTGNGSKDYVYKLNRKNPLVIRFNEIFDALTVGQIEALADDMTISS